MAENWKKDIPTTTLYIYKEEPFATYNPYYALVGKPKRENIEEIIVEEGHPRLISVDNCLIDIKTSRLLLVCKNSKIPSFIKSIGQDVFQNGLYIDKMDDIPNAVKEICWGAFSRCKELKEINMPNSITTIGPFAFFGCKNLVDICFPNSVRTIKSSAFENCQNLKSVVFSEKLTTLKQEAFASCYSLESVKFGANVKFIAANTFKDCNNLVIYAPIGSYAEQYAKKHKIKFEAV